MYIPQTGDIVMLNSGGPLMTVVELSSKLIEVKQSGESIHERQVICMWGLEHKYLLPLSASFYPEQLTLIKASKCKLHLN